MQSKYWIAGYTEVVQKRTSALNPAKQELLLANEQDFPGEAAPQFFGLLAERRVAKKARRPEFGFGDLRRL
jgi:hypothetical protein